MDTTRKAILRLKHGGIDFEIEVHPEDAASIVVGFAEARKKAERSTPRRRGSKPTQAVAREETLTRVAPPPLNRLPKTTDVEPFVTAGMATGAPVETREIIRTLYGNSKAPDKAVHRVASIFGTLRVRRAAREGGRWENTPAGWIYHPKEA